MKKQTKRERIAAILAGLPPDCGVMPASELDAEEIENRERLFPAIPDTLPPSHLTRTHTE